MNPLPILAAESWRDDAACSGTDPELFFAGDPESVETARALCEGCPVRTPCLEAALALGEMHGVWGGVTEGQRRRMIRARRREARASASASAAA